MKLKIYYEWRTENLAFLDIALNKMGQKFKWIYIYMYIYMYIYILLLLTGSGGHANFFFISTQNIILISKSLSHSRGFKICTYTIQRIVIKAV